MANLKVECQSAILEEAVGSRLLDGKRVSCEIYFADFDDVLFKLTVVPGQESVLTLNVGLPCYRTIMEHGGKEHVEKIYGGMITQCDEGYHFALSVDCDSVSDPDALLANLMHVKRNLLGAPLIKAFNMLNDGTAKSMPFVTIPYRKTESIYVKAANDPANPQNYDRITVVISLDFPDETDRAYARIFMQQLNDVQRKVNNAPPLQIYEADKPPMEIQGEVKNINPNIVGYISFTIFRPHVKTPEKLNKAVDLIIGFRQYIHFHIKAAKTNLHMRMRRKVTTWLQVLNRAVMVSEAPKAMKTSSGKTFTRK